MIFPRACALTLLCASIPAFATDVGTTAGALSVSSTGAAVYNVPIIVPPGIAGLAPHLSVVYDSRAGDGLVGYRAALTGLSQISRCEAKLDPDGYASAVSFTSSDRFCLDGKKLVAYTGSGGYTGVGTEYRTELESFRRIISIGGVAGDPQSFKVLTKSGLILEYGNTSDSRIAGQGKTQALVWAVNKISDTVGNYMTVTYSQTNSTGEYYPTAINYAYSGGTAYSQINFGYVSRPDASTSYVGGSLVTHSHLLSTITTYANGNFTSYVRQYTLAYVPQSSVTSQRSLLASITECGNTGCLPPTQINWQNGSTSSSALSTTSGDSINSQYAQIMDVNGDGREDLVYPGVSNWQIRFAQSDGTLGAPVDTGIAIANMYYQYAVALDYNGDGLGDLLVPDSSNNWQLLKSTGSGLTLIATGLPVLGDRRSQVAADVNGDGLPDLVWADGVTKQINVRLNTPSGFSSTVQTFWSLTGTGFGNFAFGAAAKMYQSVIRTADFNGDGQADLLVLTTTTEVIDTVPRTYITYYDWNVLISTGTSFAFSSSNPIEEGINVADQPFLLDINGDGKTDIGYIQKGSSLGYFWQIYISHGDGTFGLLNSSAPVNPPGNTVPGTVAVLDYDGDGKTDLLVSTQTDWYWLRSTGSDFSSTFVDTGIQSNTASPLYPKVMDLNGDGLSDLLFASGTNVASTLHQGSYPDLATQVTNGLGAVGQIIYSPLTNGGVYTKGSGSTYPTMDIQYPIYVASEQRISNGLGALNRVTYSYSGAKAQMRGRGFLGFAQRNANDLAKGILQTESFRQDFPYTGLPASAVTTLSGTTTKVSDKATTYSDQAPTYAAGGTSYFLFAQHAAIHLYELNGSNPLVLSQTTDNSYDDSGYVTCSATTGNLTSSTISTFLGSEVGNTASFVSAKHNTYCDDSTNWFLGHVIKTTLQRTNDVGASLTRTSAFEYNATTGLLSAEITEPGNATLQVRTDYTRDIHGNITQATVSPAGLSARNSTAAFDTRGQFPISITNAAGLTEQPTFDPNSGSLVSVVDPNNLMTRWTYDGYGRVTSETRPDSTSTTISRTLCGLVCASGYGAYFTTTSNSDGSAEKIELDALEREVAKQAAGFDGSWIQRLTEYNAQGWVNRASKPHFAGGAILWTAFQYDAVGRLARQNAPDANRPSGSITGYSYSGLTTQKTDPLNNTTTTVLNALGNVVRVTDAVSNITTYAYDPFDDLLSVTVPGGSTTSMQYNVRGWKTAMSDPDMGAWSYQYDSLGELIQQLDAKGQTVSLGYDALGRVLSRTELEGTANWTYDTVWKGALTQESGPGVTRSYSYNGLGQVTQISTVADSQTLNLGYSYDSQGRISQTTYPDGFVAQNTYNVYGYLSQVTSPTTNVTYWTANSMDVRGHVSSFALGNGATTTRAYDDATGVLKSTQTTSNIQSLGYSWDTVGNLVSRTDQLQGGLTEQFSYDSLYRLQSSTLNGVQNLSLTYDAAGNIAGKSGVGTYVYGSKPHAVASISGTRAATYSYDANGNQTGGAGRSISWTSYNYPSLITQNGNSSSFVYGPRREMVKQTLSRTVTPGASPVVAAPTAKFTFSCTGLSCSFDASGSSDPVGITSYSWNFGDGQTATGPNPGHTYSDAGAGNYAVTLTVTGTDSQTSTATATVTAYSDRTKFSYTCNGVSCSFDASDSRFHPGIASYSWSFGDGQTATGPNPSHTYSDVGAGTYAVTLTVTNLSQQTSATRTTVAAYSDRTTFSFSCNGLVCSFDASDSRYHPGISSYRWTFGDGQSSSLVAPTHTYYVSGTYPATLTITNTSNATSTVSRAVTVQVGMQNNSLLCGDLALPSPICPPVTGATEPNTGPVSLPAGSNTMYAPPADLDEIFSVSWSTASSDACPGNCQYLLEVAQNSSFINAEVIYTGPALSYQINGMTPGTYYFRVSALYQGIPSAYFTGPSISVVGSPVLTGPTYASSSSGTQTGSSNVSSVSGTQTGSSNTSSSGGPASLAPITENKTIYYAGGIYEFDSQSNEKKHFIVAGGEAVAVYTTRGALTGTRYLHSDHLGSVSVTSDESAHLMENLSYDSYGKRRMPNWADDPSDSQLYTQHAFDEGFTYQNHLDHVGLIHMKGRVYDPILGRFASADPVWLVKAIGQARYAYVLNNPLNRIDPTGFSDHGLFGENCNAPPYCGNTSPAERKRIQEFGNYVADQTSTAESVLVPVLFAPSLFLGAGEVAALPSVVDANAAVEEVLVGLRTAPSKARREVAAALLKAAARFFNKAEAETGDLAAQQAELRLEEGEPAAGVGENLYEGWRILVERARDSHLLDITKIEGPKQLIGPVLLMLEEFARNVREVGCIGIACEAPSHESTDSQQSQGDDDDDRARVVPVDDPSLPDPSQTPLPPPSAPSGPGLHVPA